MPIARHSTVPVLVAVLLSASILLTSLLPPPVSTPSFTHGGWLTSQLPRSLHAEHTLNFPPTLLAVNNGSQALGNSIQVGAWGSDDSVGNTGVQVEIRTNSYNVSNRVDDAFWVGDILNDGSFIQFGYLILSPGYYCLTGHIMSNGASCEGNVDNVGFSDARWFWAYFPSMASLNDWYYGFGPSNSVGTNGTWHLYSISPDASGDWNFGLDGVTVYSSNFGSASSGFPAHLVAEQASGEYLAPLGPVEFRNLAYLANDSLWHGASSLTTLADCDSGTTSACSNNTGYGVELLRANDLTAGSDLSTTATGVIWQREAVCSLNTSLTSVDAIGDAPLNVTLIDSVTPALGNFTTNWWFGNGAQHDGNSSQTVTYKMPGNYTPVVRVLDSAGCLSEASGKVSVTTTNAAEPPSSSIIAPSFTDDAITICAVPSPRNPYGPNQ